jgi:FAD/FMN-containing dehydrogenase
MTQGSDAPRWAERLRGALEGEVLTDAASRGRYATDASIYQCFPAAVVLPKSASDLAAVLEIASEAGIGATVRGGGTSTAGQTLTDGIVIDCSKYLNRFLFHDEGSRSCVVEPGITLDEVNRRLRGERLWFPVDSGLGHAATIGGMLGNNSSGIRALRYGRMADNVIAVDALLAGGVPVTFRDAGESDPSGVESLPEVILDLLHFGEEKEAELRALWVDGRLPPSGADLGCLLPSDEPQRLARLLAGAEGQLAIATVSYTHLRAHET